MKRTDPFTPWFADPLVWIGVAVAVIAHVFMLFAGPYLPYIDWSNHLGLISIFAHGGDTGALAYADRSWAPTPYLLFYAVTAAFAQFTSVPVAAKLSLLLATALLPLAAAWLAQTGGRSPRLGLIAPLGLFGYALGYGFASYVFTLPFAVFALAATERLIDAPKDRRALIRAAVLYLLCYLGHALLFAFTALAITIRVLIFALSERSLRPLLTRFALAFLPTFVVAVPTLLALLIGAGPQSEEAPPDRWLTFTAVSQHLANVGGHLLERGSDDHWLTMKLALGFLLGLLALSVVRALPAPNPKRYGLEVYAAFFAALYLFGPASIERPVEVWMVYPRFAVLGALFIFLLPRTDLSGWLGGAVASLALGLVIHNASINARHIQGFSSWAKQYDPVRAMIPRGARVLALTVVGGGDLATFHPALGSLYFYHLADGAAYSAFLFDNPLHPVRPKREGRPRAPFWRNIGGFDPAIHGIDFDYVVARGDSVISKLAKSDLHERVGEANGWHVFRTKTPPPWPKGARPPRPAE